MAFVKNFTLPNFQAKNFTPSISPNFSSFSEKKHTKWVNMEKLTPLAKILHFRRQWREGQTSPLDLGLIKMHICNDKVTLYQLKDDIAWTLTEHWISQFSATSINNMSNEYDAGSSRKNSRTLFKMVRQRRQTRVEHGMCVSLSRSHPKSHTNVNARKFPPVWKLQAFWRSNWNSWRSLTAWRALKSLFLQTRTSEQKKWCISTLQQSCSHKRRRCSQHDVCRSWFERRQNRHCIRDAILSKKCSFFVHCSKGLWPPPPFYLNICPILQGVFFKVYFYI